MAKVAMACDGTLTWMCPACGSGHGVPVPQWQWNESLTSPSLQPSVRITWEYGEPPTVKHCCHFTMTDGQVAFGTDCTHELRGKTVPLEEF